MRRFYPLILLSLLFLSACSEGKLKLEQHVEQVTEEEVPDSVKVMQLATEILQALDKGDYSAIGDAVGNDGRVRFSPYGMVDSLQNTLTKAELYSTPQIEMAWGNFDGSGDPIQLSIANYFKKFVYNQKYASDPNVQTSYNQPIGSGNSLNNLKAFYPDHHFVEYYFPGTDEYEHMDWSCLRLVFKKEGDSFLLVGIIHDQWTI